MFSTSPHPVRALIVKGLILPPGRRSLPLRTRRSGPGRFTLDRDSKRTRGGRSKRDGAAGRTCDALRRAVARTRYRRTLGTRRRKSTSWSCTVVSAVCDGVDENGRGRPRTLLRARNLRVRFLPPFYDDPGYLDAVAARLRAHYPADTQYLLFSYHGLPKRHLRKADPTHAHCCGPRIAARRRPPPRDLLPASGHRDDARSGGTDGLAVRRIRTLLSVRVWAAAGCSRSLTSNSRSCRSAA